MVTIHPFAQKQMKQHHTSSPLGQSALGDSCISNTSERQQRKFARLIECVDSPWLVNVFSIAIGVAAGLLEFFTHLVIGRMNVRAGYHAFVDASLIALLAIALVGMCFASARARRKVMLDRVRTASDLNHHVRNALQVITLSRYLPEEKQSEAVYSSIDRIDDALKRLSPR